MSIIGIGNDIVEIGRIRNALGKHGEAFVRRLLTPGEIALAGSKYDPVIFYAGRWAAKEACAKALRCGIGEKCSFTDITVLNNENGAPEITLTGNALNSFQQLGGSNIFLSISHEKDYAVATVVIG